MGRSHRTAGTDTLPFWQGQVRVSPAVRRSHTCPGRFRQVDPSDLRSTDGRQHRGADRGAQLLSVYPKILRVSEGDTVRGGRR
ncbi:hypothetical protein GCM10010365_68610 [Streptomyces poonensis]|uniref:Uncharacterized protein n=1 Tax=Streptomyces poonensis TaxID=68255 RepID=A0A918UVV6_9ACTN|nr:hypothetical protein GCM10010365_68610 [Streptomyces poonensis]GLJ91079.1 hypothetical protein GCM10017589_36850 [Streptomyces poonensis]